MKIEQLFTSNGFQTALKRYHKHLHDNYNFPKLNGVKPLHKFAETFGLTSAEPFVAALDAIDKNNLTINAATLHIVIRATTATADRITTTLCNSHDQALETLRDAVKDDIEVLSNADEIADNFMPDSDEEPDYQQFINTADESTLCDIFKFLHSYDAFAEIRELSVTDTEKSPAKTAETRLDRLLNGGDLSEEDIARIDRQDGWHIRNDSGEYLDWEVEKTYAQETDEHDRLSLNLVVTFNREDGGTWFEFGENRGSGFNDYISGSFDKDTTIREALIANVNEAYRDSSLSPHKKDFLTTIRKHEDIYHQILIAAQGFDDFLLGKA